MTDKGVLAEEVKKLVERNSRELSTIDGTLFCGSSCGDLRTILVTSCASGEGKTVSAISMATAISLKANMSVVLADANLQAPKLHKLFGIDESPGFSDMVLSGTDFAAAAQATEYENLMVIPHGSDVKRKLDVFDTDKFKTTLASLRQTFKCVIVDGPGVFGMAAVPLIARHFDGILFVLECERTRWEVLQEATEKVTGAGGKILGVVMNKRKFYVPRIFYG